MWVITEYLSSSLFTLKSSLATSSAGKTLLVPTPFSLKMALLNAAIHSRGLPQGEEDFHWLRNIRVAISPANKAVVTNLFAKIQKPRRTDQESQDTVVSVELEEEDNSNGPFGPTIAYREYVHLQGRLGLAFELEPTLETPERLMVLGGLLLHINYLGKRGSFFQLVKLPWQTEELPSGYVDLTREGGAFFYGGILQVLDDCGPDMTFEKADIYSEKKIKLGKDRILKSIVLPYELKRSSRSYSFYQRIDQEVNNGGNG